MLRLESDEMGDNGWVTLEGLDAVKTEFPARARYGEEVIVVHRLTDGFRGVQRNCPHLNTDLSRGILMAEDKMIRCALHAYTFKLIDGKGVNCPGYKIDVYEVRCTDRLLMARKVETE